MVPVEIDASRDRPVGIHRGNPGAEDVERITPQTFAN
jgi:hypothetical protein